MPTHNQHPSVISDPEDIFAILNFDFADIDAAAAALDFSSPSPCNSSTDPSTSHHTSASDGLLILDDQEQEHEQDSMDIHHDTDQNNCRQNNDSTESNLLMMHHLDDYLGQVALHSQSSDLETNTRSDLTNTTTNHTTSVRSIPSRSFPCPLVSTSTAQSTVHSTVPNTAATWSPSLIFGGHSNANNVHSIGSLFPSLHAHLSTDQSPSSSSTVASSHEFLHQSIHPNTLSSHFSDYSLSVNDSLGSSLDANTNLLQDSSINTNTLPIHHHHHHHNQQEVLSLYASKNASCLAALDGMLKATNEGIKRCNLFIKNLQTCKQQLTNRSISNTSSSLSSLLLQASTSNGLSVRRGCGPMYIESAEGNASLYFLDNFGDGPSDNLDVAMGRGTTVTTKSSTIPSVPSAKSTASSVLSTASATSLYSNEQRRDASESSAQIHKVTSYLPSTAKQSTAKPSSNPLTSTVSSVAPSAPSAIVFTQPYAIARAKRWTPKERHLLNQLVNRAILLSQKQRPSVSTAPNTATQSSSAQSTSNTALSTAQSPPLDLSWWQDIAKQLSCIYYGQSEGYYFQHQANTHLNGQSTNSKDYRTANACRARWFNFEDDRTCLYQQMQQNEHQHQQQQQGSNCQLMHFQLASQLMHLQSVNQFVLASFSSY